MYTDEVVKMKIKCELTIPIFAKIVRPYIGNGIKANGKYAEAFFKTFRRDPLDTDVSDDNIKTLTPKLDTLRRYIKGNNPSKGPSQDFAQAFLQVLDKEKAMETIDDLYDDQKEIIYEKLVKYCPDLRLEKLGEGCTDIFKELMIRYSENYYKENKQTEEEQKFTNTSTGNLQQSDDEYFKKFKKDYDDLLQYCISKDPSVNGFEIKRIDEIRIRRDAWDFDCRKITNAKNSALVKNIVETLYDYESLFDAWNIKNQPKNGYFKFKKSWSSWSVSDEELLKYIEKANKLRHKLASLYGELFPWPIDTSQEDDTAKTDVKQNPAKHYKNDKPLVPLEKGRFDRKSGTFYYNGEEIHISTELLDSDKEEIQTQHLPYETALTDVYSERINKNITPENIKELPKPLQFNFETQRKAYYSIEGVRRSVRDAFRNGEEQFTYLEEDTYYGIVDTYYDDRIENGYARLMAVLNKATNISLKKSLLLNIPSLIGNNEKRGICHMLVNDGKIKSWVNPYD